MGQLSRRLREVLPLYGIDPRLHQAELDAIDARERADPAAAHDLFEALRLKVARGRHRELHERLRAHAFVTDLFPADTSTLKLRDLDQEINELQEALRHAEAVAAALAEARGHASALRDRAARVDEAPFRAVPMRELGKAAVAAEAVRRAAAQEARVEERLLATRQRSARLTRRQVAVPDLSSAAVPDPGAAAERLTALEGELSAAEAVEEAHGRVVRLLRDAAVREFKRETARTLEGRADAASLLAPAEAVPALRKLEAEAERLRVEAAGLARSAARARRVGGTGPERERKRGGDLPDYFG
ncbi:MAG TPA: hypothetical protein VNZ52_12035 [Candidatus Thermoplasmatota archaeon]|nr:hypothetical protein [Candidatus Thermoplasmatota archaeon]